MGALLLSVLTLLAGASELKCRPLASSSNGLPEICHSDSYRDELVAYLNVSDIYLLDPTSTESRWIDRVELVPDLAENQIEIGKKRIVLRLNSFLRARDVREFFESVRPRVNLVKASKETDSLLKKLALSDAVSYLNTSIALREYLDAPFLSASGDTISADVLAEEPAKQDVVSAVAVIDCKKIQADRERARRDVQIELRRISRVEKRLAATVKQTPSKIPVGRSLADLADGIELSDCDLCHEAVYYCKSQGHLPKFTPQKNNCHSVAKDKECLSALPPALAAPVDFCLGTPPDFTLKKLQARSTVLEKELANLTAQVEDAKSCGSP